jgi:TolB protein
VVVRLWAVAIVLVLVVAVLGTADAEFTHRYPKVAGYAHQIYLEGYDLPVLAAGPTDPAAAPDGRSVAIAARGWIWILDLSTREAWRLTRGAGIDSRPAWSPDGTRLALVRDDGRDTSVVAVDPATGAEEALVDTKAIDLDPVFAPDGRTLFYSSAESGDLDLWKLDVRSRTKKRLTSTAGLELRPQPLPDGERIVFLARQGDGTDQVVLMNLKDGKRRVLVQEWMASQSRPAVSLDGRTLAVSLPQDDGWTLSLRELAGGAPIRVAPDAALPLAPAWSPDGAFVYFSEADNVQRFRLWRVAVAGGPVLDVSPRTWSWGEDTGELVLRTRRRGSAEAEAARVSVLDGNGHPAVPAERQCWFDSQNGLVYFYSEGVTTVEVPAGEVRITATRGVGTPAVTETRTVHAGERVSVDLELVPLWDPSAHGWYSGDHHWHLNYGGPYRLAPEDILPALRGEALDVATPLVASLNTRLIDAEWWGWQRLTSGPPLVVFGQEVRSNFLGHVALLGMQSLFWPWFWGPDYPVYGADDRPNAEALAHARAEGGLGAYVHPVLEREPFRSDGVHGLPLELVPDVVLGDVDTLDVACLWSDELGTSDLWYRLLNLGVALAPSAGTDAFPNLYRTMAIGATRVYVRVDGELTLATYLQALRAGRSFVTNGPLLRFVTQKARPGEVVAARAGRDLHWILTVASPIAVEKVEILVNGRVAWSADGLADPGQRIYRGHLQVPRAGWIAARVHGGAPQWPVMDSYPFAHTAPVWLDHVGSHDPTAAREAARELLRWLDTAKIALALGYHGAPIPKLQRRFAEARKRLEGFTRQAESREE